MATITKIATTVDVVATIQLNADELLALDALSCYGVDAFIAFFYKHMGTAYLRSHESGLRSFLEAVRGCGRMVDSARECRQFLSLEEADRRRAIGHLRDGTRP